MITSILIENDLDKGKLNPLLNLNNLTLNSPNRYKNYAGNP